MKFLKGLGHNPFSEKENGSSPPQLLDIFGPF